MALKFEYVKWFFSWSNNSFARFDDQQVKNCLTYWNLEAISLVSYADINGHLELTLLKGRQRFDANLHEYKFRDWWIFTYFIFGYDESSPYNIWSMVNLERTCVLLFYYVLYFKVNLDLEKTNHLGKSSPNFIFAVVNLNPIILEQRWIDGESWPNDFVEKVNRSEDLRWVGSGCPLMCALVNLLQGAYIIFKKMIILRKHTKHAQFLAWGVVPP